MIEVRSKKNVEVYVFTSEIISEKINKNCEGFLYLEKYLTLRINVSL